MVGNAAFAVGRERRGKWARQIRQTVDQLHEIGVVWGDGKTENVLVDSETDDAWLIDFGGGFTEGWVDVGVRETVEGDHQAPKKIIHVLGVE